MNQQHTGLDIRGNRNTAPAHLGEPAGRVFEAPVIPCEGAALNTFPGFHGAVAGGELEAVCGNILFPGGVDKAQNGIVAVFRQFGIVHGAAEVPQSRPGQHHRFAGQVGVACDDLTDGRACDQEQIHVPRIRTVGAVAVPVVALLPAHVEVTFGGVVVEVTHSLTGISIQLDVEGNMLVQGVRFPGVIAHGIAGCHVQILLRLVDFAGLFAEAIEAILFFDLARVDAAVVAVLPVGKIRDIRMDQRAVPIIDQNPERAFLHHNLQPAAPDHSPGFLIGQLGRCGGDSFAAVLHQLIRPGLPGSHHQTVGCLVPVPVKTCPDAQNVIGQKPDADLHRVGRNGKAASKAAYLPCCAAYFHGHPPFVLRGIACRNPIL